MSTITHERTPTQKKIDETMLKRVKKGIAWLEEEHGPDWVDHIDLATLDLSDGDACVLGQLYRNKGEGMCGYDYALRLHSLDIEFRRRYGFTIKYKKDWGALQDAWEQVLTPMVTKP